MHPIILKSSFLRILCLLSFIAAFPAWAPAAESAAKSKTSAKSAKSGAKIDLNTADAATLETLPGVGPATARAIIARRPFASVSELESVPGIGPAKLAELRDQVTASSRSAAKKESAAKGEKEKTADRPRSEAASRTTAGEKTKSTRDTDAKTTASTSGKSTSAGREVDVNTADAATLETLPGVGPSTAQAIIAARPFASVDDLERVSGIGAARLAALRDQVTVSSRTSSTAKTATGEATRKSTTTATPRTSDRDQSRTDVQREKLEPTGRTATSAAGAQGKKVNLNTATLAELEALPEIGPVKAQAIIEARPFSTIEDVMKVTGIKEGIFEEIKDQITVK